MSVKRTFTAIIIPDPDGGYTAEIPILPGCLSQGETWDEVIEHIKEAAALWLEVWIEKGNRIPRENHLVAAVPVELTIDLPDDYYKRPWMKNA